MTVAALARAWVTAYESNGFRALASVATSLGRLLTLSPGFIEEDGGGRGDV